MSAFTIVPAGKLEARLLAPNLREVDKQEVLAANGQEPEDALLASVESSDTDMCWAALIDGKVTALFGVAGVTEQVGAIWLLASDDIYQHKVDFMRHCKEMLELMHLRYPSLLNFIDDRNQVTKRWLKRLGFWMGHTDPEFGQAQIPFTLFISTRL